MIIYKIYLNSFIFWTVGYCILIFWTPYIGEINSVPLNFLSLTKNIKADILNYKTIPINKESMTDIIDVNKYNQICFTFEKTTIYDFGSLTFDLYCL